MSDETRMDSDYEGGDGTAANTASVFIRVAVFMPGDQPILLRESVQVNLLELHTMKVKLSVAALLKVSPTFERLEKATADAIGDAITR